MRFSLFFLLPVLATTPAFSADPPTREEAVAAVKKAADFFRTRVASHGGYVWRYSSDLKHRQGEGLANENIIWVQPPGTPAVGLAFLDISKATGDRNALQAARAVADALVKGQLHSGGWYYSITFDPKDRLKFHYRKPPSKGKPRIQVDSNSPGGWAEWRRRRYKGNITTMDDETTQAALMLLMRVDKALGFKNREIHEAAQYGLASILRAQYPIGAWSHNYDRFPPKTPSAAYYPVKKASYPETWSRKWPKDFSGCYELNDEITLDAIETLLEAHRIYGDVKYLDAAKRGGRFLLLAQLPEPQPAWAQQYDRHVQPVWARKFEPPAITAGESQSAIATLLRLYEYTGDARFLTPIPKALAYLRRSRLKDGRLARFYELKTNKPLYFNRKYQLTTDPDDLPTHYGFIVNSRLDRLHAWHRRLEKDGRKSKPPATTRKQLAGKVRRIIDAMDRRGAWTEPGWVRNASGRKVTPRDGVIQSATFIANVRTLCQYITAR
jgi:hypothetical protein